MANDTDIKIGLKTVGADTAAREIGKVPDAIEQIPASVPDAVDAIDEIPAAIDKIPEVVDDANAHIDEQNEAFRRAAEAAEEHSQKLGLIADATRVMLSLQTLEVLKKAIGGLKEAAAEGGVLREELGDMKPALDTVDAGLDSISAGLSAAVATGNPLVGMLAGIAAGFGNVVTTYQKMREEEDAARASEQAAFDMKLKQLAWEDHYKKNLAAISQVPILEAEVDALHQQEDSLKRMIALREGMRETANTGLRQEVELAKLKGGDVALAEANVIAGELEGGLQSLNDKLAAAKARAETATREEQATNKAWQIAQMEVSQGLRGMWDEETQAIKKAAEDAAQEGQKERDLLAGIQSKYGEDRKNILRGAEIELERKETEYSGQISTAANQAFSKIFSTLREESSKSQTEVTQAVAAIQADTTVVTQAVQAKAQEVSTSMQGAADSSAQSVQNLGASAAARSAGLDQAIGAASSQVIKSLDLLTDKVVTALARISATSIANANKIASQQAQINQLYARLR